MPRSLGRTGRRWRRARARLMAETPDVCWICGHSGGANDADHEPSLKLLEAAGLDPCDPQFLRRAHGVDGCPTCGKRCNQAKGSGPAPLAHQTSRVW